MKLPRLIKFKINPGTERVNENECQAKIETSGLIYDDAVTDCHLKRLTLKNKTRPSLSGSYQQLNYSMAFRKID